VKPSSFPHRALVVTLSVDDGAAEVEVRVDAERDLTLDTNVNRVLVLEEEDCPLEHWQN
jgi:hypothetical protein